MRESTDHYFNTFSLRFWFGQIDLRPLGFMRIVFGSVLLWSTIDLAPVLRTFFSDEGVAPRAAYIQGMARFTRISIFDIAGPNWVLYALYATTLLAIVALTVGWHTRAATVAAFVLVSGIHERNLVVYDSSDNVLRVMLFWMMFMPAGARYSVDAALRTVRGLPLVTHACAMPMRLGQLQIAWVYLCTMIFKWPGVPWHDGTALRIALGLEHLFTRRLGDWLFERQWFTVLGTRATVVIELAFLPLVFLPLWRPKRGLLSRLPEWLFQPSWKGWGIALVTSLHLAIAATMSVGNFSWVMISTYFLMYEPEWIEAIVGFVHRTRAWRATAPWIARAFHRLVGDPASWRAANAGASPIARLVQASVGAWGRSFVDVVVLPVLMMLGMWMSLPDDTRIPPLVVGGHSITSGMDLSPSHAWRPATLFVEELELWQRWNMFSPYPLDHDAYIMGRGRLSDGTEVDVLRGDRGNGGPLLPPVKRGFFFTRWTKYISNILFEPRDSPQVLEFGRFICREWNAEPLHGRALLATFKLYREEHRIALFGETEPDGWHEVEIWDHRCF